MKRERRLVAASDENFVVSFRKLAEHSPDGEVRTVDGIFAFVTGLPVSYFNGCVVTRPASAASLVAALEWVARRGVPHRLWVAEGLLRPLRDVPPAFGLAREPDPHPGMALHPVPERPMPADGVSVAPADVDAFLAVSVDGGLRRELAELLVPVSFGSDPDVQLFVGRLDGRPVGTAIAIASPRASGIYNVTTLPDARRRGVGAALTWAAVSDGVARGHDIIVLQSTEMGISLYSAMGFRTVAPYAMFGPAASP